MHLYAAFAGFLAVSLGALANDVGMTKQQIADAVCLESVTIPTPGEFFAAIDKLDTKPSWAQLFRPQAVSNTNNRAQMALNLGTLVADGYIAVEAEDSQSVKNVGKDITGLAKKLNVNQSIIGRGSSINDFAENNDWSALREELEATQDEAKQAMADQKDTNLVILVTLGAWIRGIDVASGFIEKNYSPDAARLLRQPAIIGYLISQIEKLPPDLRSDVLISRVYAGLQAAQNIVNIDAAAAISQQEVKGLHDIMSALVKNISQGPGTT